MSFRAGLDEQVGRLVHQAALVSPALAAQHSLFIETRLVAGIGGLALVPGYLVSGGVPGWVEPLVLVWLTLPLLAVAMLSSRGLLAGALRLSQIAWAGLATTLAFGEVASAVTATLVLMLVPLECAFHDDPRGVRQANLGFVLLAGLILATKATSAHTLHTADLVFAGGAIAYAALLVVRGVAVRTACDAAVHADLADKTILFDAIGDLALRFEGLMATVLNPSQVEANLGLGAGDLAGRGFLDRVHVQDRPLFLKRLSDAAHGGVQSLDHLRLRAATRPGRAQGCDEPVFATVEVRIRSLSCDGKQASTLVLLRVAPTVVEEAPSAPAPATTEADAQAWRDRFLATVSHELRTPLNAIIGFSEMMASGFGASLQPEKQKEYASIIHGSGQHLLEIVNSMLDLSKIDAGKLDLVLEPFDVNALLAACCDMMRLKAENGRLDLEHVGSRVPLRMIGDARACRQIILNLLSNALKFTPEFGRVVISAAGEGAFVAVSVTDTGIGILPPDLANLGDPFFQAQNAYDRRFEGTGLGLCVVRGLVGLHGGSITAESAPGEGTCITVRLPAEARPVQTGSRANIETIARPPRRVALDHEPAKVCRLA